MLFCFHGLMIWSASRKYSRTCMNAAHERIHPRFSQTHPRGCFADRYFDQGKANDLHQVQQRIDEASQESRTAKEAGLQRINAEFLIITEKWSTSSCTHKRHPDSTHDIRGCRHCYYFRSRRRMKIQVHEDFLPRATNQAERRAIVFELDIPVIRVLSGNHLECSKLPLWTN